MVEQPSFLGLLVNIAYLIKSPNKQPQLLVWQPANQRVGDIFRMLVPTQISNLHFAMVLLCSAFLVVIGFGEGMRVRRGIEGRIA